MIALMRCRPTGNATQLFVGVAVTFNLGAVAFVLFWPLGLAVWAFAAVNVVRWARYQREVRTARTAQRELQAQWDARWARWGGRLP